MTREEAKTRLQMLLVDRCSTCRYGDGKCAQDCEFERAVNMAIEALKTEPIRCGECENYIDRRCIEANHHVAAHGNCMNVFGAKWREL